MHLLKSVESCSILLHLKKCFLLLLAAMDYLLHHPSSDVNIAEFEKECGVGVVVTAEEIKYAVSVISALFCYICFV